MGNSTQNWDDEEMSVVDISGGDTVVVVVRSVVVTASVVVVIRLSVQLSSATHLIESRSGTCPDSLHLNPWLYSPSTHSNLTLQHVGENIHSVPEVPLHSSRASSSGNLEHHLSDPNRSNLAELTVNAALITTKHKPKSLGIIFVTLSARKTLHQPPTLGKH